MKHIKSTASMVVTATTIAIGLCPANADDVDWKMYGYASISGPEACFYDAIGITRTPDRRLRVWTKCLSILDMENINIEKEFGGRIVESTAEKIAHYYIPPFTEVQDFDFDHYLVIVQQEVTANISFIKPHSKIFYEIDCSQKMMRELSITLEVNGKSGSQDKPRSWRFISPESNGSSLHKLLCR